MVGHFFKHKVLLEIETLEDYYQMANNFIDSKLYTHSWVAQGKKYYYDIVDKVVVILGSDDEIKSFYKATKETAIKDLDNKAIKSVTK